VRCGWDPLVVQGGSESAGHAFGLPLHRRLYTDGNRVHAIAALAQARGRSPEPRPFAARRAARQRAAMPMRQCAP
jgi:hypothetical protein